MPCRDTSRGRHSRRLACWRSPALGAYCNFESKQAIYLGDAQIIRRATSAWRPGVGFEVRTSCIHTTKFYALEVGKLPYRFMIMLCILSFYYYMFFYFLPWFEFSMWTIWVSNFARMFICGIFNFETFFLQLRKTLKTHIIKCQYGINKWEVVSLENVTRSYMHRIRSF